MLSQTVKGQNKKDTTKQTTTVKDTIWKYKGNSEINFSQGYLNNWAAGGDDYLSTLLLSKYTLSYNKNKLSWENILSYKLGGTQQGKIDMRKTDDLFEFNSKLGCKLSNNNFYFSNIINFKTQILKGFDYANGNDSIAIATGLEYKPNKQLTALMSIISGKATFISDTSKYNPTLYGVDSSQNHKLEMGAYLRVIYQNVILKNISYNTSLILFSNYFNNPQNIDIDWQLTVKLKVTKYINTMIFGHLVYDDDVLITQLNGLKKKAIQFKETIGIGISYSF